MIIFDCDGVLVDSEILAVRQEVDAFDELGIAITFEEIVDQYVGLSYATMERRVNESYGVELPPGFFEKIQADTLASFPAELKPVAGMVDLVASVAGSKCVASSSNLDRILLSLQVTGHDSFTTDHIFSAQMVEHGKPAPDLFLYAAAQVGVDPRVCTVVEDSPHGVQGAVAAGMRVIGLVAAGHCSPALADRLRAAGADDIAADAAELGSLIL